MALQAKGNAFVNAWLRIHLETPGPSTTMSVTMFLNLDFLGSVRSLAG